MVDPITGHRIIQPAPSNDVQNQQPQEQIAPPADFDLDAQLPPFVHPPPSTMSLEDVYYLCIKEAFTLPPASLQQALIQAYIQHVHPMLPLLDVYPLLGTVSNLNNQRTRVSLLLYQAVMFSGAAFVNEESLLNCGYQSRRGARDVFFGKTRVSTTRNSAARAFEHTISLTLCSCSMTSIMNRVASSCYRHSS